MKYLASFALVLTMFLFNSSFLSADVAITSLMQTSEAHVDGPFGADDSVLSNLAVPAITLNASALSGDGDASGDQVITGWTYNSSTISFSSAQNALGSNFGTATDVSALNSFEMIFTVTTNSVLDYTWDTDDGIIKLVKVGSGTLFSHSGTTNGVDSIGLVPSDYIFTIDTTATDLVSGSITSTFALTSPAVPEPGSSLVLGCVMGVLGFRNRRRRSL